MTLYTISLFFLFQVYIGYPLLLVLISSISLRYQKKQTHRPTPLQKKQHSFSILIACYNEESVIEETIQNKINQHYPKDKIEIIVISDHSNDNTNQILANLKQTYPSQLNYEILPERSGKSISLNRAYEIASGEILIFSDANSLFKLNALEEYNKAFQDRQIGYVTGRLIQQHNNKRITNAIESNFYHHIENILRQLESNIQSTISINGGVDAMRYDLYKPLKNYQLPDFTLPLYCIEQQKRVIYKNSIISYEENTNALKDEFHMRYRIALRFFNSMKDLKRFLNPIKYPWLAYQLFFHKIFRFLSFIFYWLFSITNLFLLDKHIFFQLTFLGNCFLLLCLAMNIFPSLRKYFFTKIPLYLFTFMNASFYAFLTFLIKNHKQAHWTPRKGFPNA